jgi:hypothetical protein
MRNAPALAGALTVEMAGVEPASEERTIAMSYAHSRSFKLRRCPTERQVQTPVTPRAPLARRSSGIRRVTAGLSCLESTPFRNTAGEVPQDGLPNYLSSQCVVVVGTSVFPLYLRATRRARCAIPTIPFPVETTASPTPKSTSPAAQNQGSPPLPTGNEAGFPLMEARSAFLRYSKASWGVSMNRRSSTSFLLMSP